MFGSATPISGLSALQDFGIIRELSAAISADDPETIPRIAAINSGSSSFLLYFYSYLTSYFVISLFLSTALTILVPY